MYNSNNGNSSNKFLLLNEVALAEIVEAFASDAPASAFKSDFGERINN